MAYPTTLDSLNDPESTDKLNSPSHSALHQAENTAIEALQTKVGADSSAVTTSHDYKLSGVATSDKATSLTGTETLTNKRLTSPKINSAVEMIADSSELNKLDGLAGAVVGTTDTQTLTNKTLTSPTLVLANTLPTADGSMGFDRTNENLQVGDGTNSQKVHMGAWISWTPTWTNVTVGNGTVTASYSQAGKVVSYKINFSLGGTSAVGGLIGFSPPVTATGLATTPALTEMGWGRVLDTGTTVFCLRAVLSTTTSIDVYAEKVDGTYNTRVATSATVPMVWATGDEFFLEGFYEAA